MSREKVRCQPTPAAADLAFAKVVSSGNNAGRVLRKQGSGSKRQAAEQIVGFFILHGIEKNMEI